MAGIQHQSRGGSRGGTDQFDWEDVKVDKHRENYLGVCVRAQNQWYMCILSCVHVSIIHTCQGIH